VVVFSFPPLTPFVRAFLITLGASFVACAILTNFVNVPVIRMLALSTYPLTPWTALQVFTHALIIPPEGAFALILAVVFVWWWLPHIESGWGRARTIQLCLVAVVCESVPTLLLGQLLPNYAGTVWGPSGISLASISAWVIMIGPDTRAGFANISFPARNWIWISLALTFINFISFKDVTHLVAELGAIGGGLLFARYVVSAPLKAPRKRTSSSRLRLVKNDDDDDEPKTWLN
jgi:hypothetical protein